MSSAIHIEGLHKSFGKKRVLDHLNLQVERGAVYGLVGANGAGCKPARAKPKSSACPPRVCSPKTSLASATSARISVCPIG